MLHDIWFDKWKMKAGKWFQEQMEAGLSSSDYLVLIASRSSLASNAVAMEWRVKFGDKISSNADSVFPFLVDDIKYSELPKFLSGIYSYRYEGERSNVVKLTDDILYWHDA